ncbi:9547_t:CDS:2 [Rhizophagus irregularis]|nr:9547_t:CDS:2 [Rhizophagus irregularis]
MIKNLFIHVFWLIELGVSILWRNPSLFSYFGIQKKLFNVILLLLSEESKEILKNQGMNNFITETTHRLGESNAPILRNELFKLFINKNTKFIQLTITEYFDYQVHLIPGAECCLSGLEIFYYNSKIDPNVLVGLAKICKSIKKIEINFDSYENTDSHGIFKLIEVQKNLNEFYLTDAFNRLEPFYKYLEESLIKHADTIQYLKIDWSPNTRFLSYFVNLVYLEIEKSFFIKKYNPNNLKNILLPILKILKINRVPLIATVNLIESTTGNLSEISIHCDKALRDVGCKMLIQAIYQNCPNIRRAMLLKIIYPSFKVDQQLVSLIEQYKAKGIIENYIFSIIDCGDDYENFKWI